MEKKYYDIKDIVAVIATVREIGLVAIVIVEKTSLVIIVAVIIAKTIEIKVLAI